MADKLSWTELRRALATRAGVSEKSAGVFLNALVSQLVVGLKSDRQVKINGLGTFKLQAVAPRKSVNVSTGEEIIIEGYNKIIFSPEAGLKELIESGRFMVDGEVSKPTEGDFPIDPIKKLGEQADEIVGLLADLGQGPEAVVTKPEAVVTEPEATVEEPKVIVTEPEAIVTEPEATVEEPKVIVTEPEATVEEPKVIVTEPKAVVTEPEVVVTEPEATVEEPEATVEEPKVIVTEPEAVVTEPKKKKNHFVRDVLICVLILLLLLVGGYFFFRSQLSGLLESMTAPQPQPEQVEENATQPLPEENTEVAEESHSDLDLIPEGDIPQQQILDEFNAISGDLEMEEEPYSDLITTEPMHEGSRLTWMAKRFYGDKRFWPYLYDANRDRIVNPSNIDVGTPIRVPRLTREQMDTTNSASMEALDKLRIEAEAACKK